MEQENSFCLVGSVSPSEESDTLLDNEATDSEENTTLLENEATDSEIVIVLAGKSGAGKTTLFKTLLNHDMDIELSAKPITEKAESHLIKKNGITLNIIDTPGIGDKTSEDFKKDIHLLVFCISVNPGSKFHDSNLEIMERLQAMYGCGIWRHCVVVFTFSNMAWIRAMKKAKSDKDKAIVAYKSYLEDYTKAFQEKLKTKVVVKTIFHRGDPDPSIIVTVPAGDEPEDPVLPGIETTGWVDEVFAEMIRKCKCNDKLAQYRYGRERAKKVLTRLGIIGGTTSAITPPAALLGAGIGAGAGVVGGPLGVAIGGGVGGLVGLAVGAAISATASRKIIKKSE